MALFGVSRSCCDTAVHSYAIDPWMDQQPMNRGLIPSPNMSENPE
jgi:hypothetical protein